MISKSLINESTETVAQEIKRETVVQEIKDVVVRKVLKALTVDVRKLLIEELDKALTKQKEAITTEIQKNHSISLAELGLEDLAETLANLVLPKPFHDIRQIAVASRTDVEFISRHFTQTAYLNDNLAICRVLTKYLMHVDTKDTSLSPHLCMNGYWEMWDTQAFTRIVQPGWNCIDVGANLGYFSVLLADLIGGNGRLLAVEPNPNLIDPLTRTVAINGFQSYTTIETRAIADKNGEIVRLTVPKSFVGGASIFHGEIEGQTFQVETVTLDEATKDWEKVDFVKIDAEGAEEIIWHGMRQTIEQNQNIIVVMEFSAVRYLDPKAFLENVTNLGFSIKHIDYDSEIKDLSIEECLTGRVGDQWMLFLQRN